MTTRLQQTSSALATTTMALLYPAILPGFAPLAAAQIDSYDECQRTALTSATALQQPSVSEHLLRYRSAWAHSTGSEITVAVIDTGVAQHPRLGVVRDGGDVVDGTGAHFDCDAHGTFVAGIIGGRPGADMFTGIAPDVELLSIRQTAGDDGDLYGLAQAINLAVDQRARVINISLTSCAPPHATPPGATDVVSAIQRAEAEGSVVIAASGNLGSYCEQGHVAWPAVLPEVIATAAIEYSEHGEPLPAQYSMTGNWVDIAAPGGPVLEPNPRSDGGDIPDDADAGTDHAAATQQSSGTAQSSPFANAHASRTGETRPISGTSFAAPIVSGTAALILAADPALSPPEVRNIIAQSARPISTAHGVGTGIVDPVAAVTWVRRQNQNQSKLERYSAQSAVSAEDTMPTNRVLVLIALFLTAVPLALLTRLGSSKERLSS